MVARKASNRLGDFHIGLGRWQNRTLATVKKKFCIAVIGVADRRPPPACAVAEALSPDADERHEGYADSLKSAEDSLKPLTRPRVTVEPFAIDMDDFLG